MIFQLFKYFICAFALCQFVSCSSKNEEETEADASELYTNYCGSCHLLPSPELLDNKTWKNHVLPWGSSSVLSHYK